MNLYIIGNGFDINNGLSTKYSDFANWVEENDPVEFGKINRMFCLDDLWSDFENKIADSYPLITKLVSDEIEYFNHSKHKYIYKWERIADRNHAASYSLANKIVTGVKLSKLMKEWLIQVNKNSSKIYTEEYIINFNYTDYIYGSNIINIHKSISSGFSLQVGHSQTRKIEKIFSNYSPGGNDPDENKFYNELGKNANISKQILNTYLLNKEINKIIFFGFSFGLQDIEYFESFDKEIEIDFYLKKDCESNNDIKSRVKQLFTNVKFITLKWRGRIQDLIIA